MAAPAGREQVPAAHVGYLVDQTTYENEVMHPQAGDQGAGAWLVGES